MLEYERTKKIIGDEGVEKLNSLAELEVTVDVNIDIYSLNRTILKN